MRDRRAEALSTAREVLAGKATGWRFADLARLLEQAGFSLLSKKGSHRVFRSESGARVLLVEKPGNVLPAYAKDAAKAIVALLEEEPNDQDD